MQRLDERISEEEEHAVKQMHADQSEGKKEIPVLFEEMDGVWLSMQDEQHKKMKKQEMSLRARNLPFIRVMRTMPTNGAL